MTGFRFHKAASRELIEAAGYYERRRPGLGDDFLAAVDDLVASILANPRMGEPVTDVRVQGEHRRRLLERFDYSVVYEVRHDEIVVKAVAHNRRRPGYWARRRG
jgi:plasmid stabilization system protein ParE